MSIDDLRLQPQQSAEREIAMLARMVPFEDAVKLITQYGDLRAVEGRLQQTVEHRNRLHAAEDNRGGVDA